MSLTSSTVGLREVGGRLKRSSLAQLSLSGRKGCISLSVRPPSYAHSLPPTLSLCRLYRISLFSRSSALRFSSSLHRKSLFTSSLLDRAEIKAHCYSPSPLWSPNSRRFPSLLSCPSSAIVVFAFIRLGIGPTLSFILYPAIRPRALAPLIQQDSFRLNWFLLSSSLLQSERLFARASVFFLPSRLSGLRL
jgi:hypothetical protein